MPRPPTLEIRLRFVLTMLDESVLVTTAYAFDRFFVLVLSVDRFDPPSVENVLNDPLTRLDKASVCA